MATGPVRDFAGPEGRAALTGAVETAIEELAQTKGDALEKASSQGLPERGEVTSWVERTKRMILSETDRSALRSQVPSVAERLLGLLRDVALSDGISAEETAAAFILGLPAIRSRLAEDVEAALEGDPAAKSYAEIVVSYPSIRAIAIYRIAHELNRLGVPILPRMMTEHAHDRTGIDIHPGAEIGRRFFIDHGTGVVIGETAEIGDNVRLYQGVTLGAKSPRHGEKLRGCKRHPTIEDDVTIYAGATILGGETVIGRGSVIGGNVWLVESVPAGSRVITEAPRQLMRQRKEPDPIHWEI